MQGRGAAVRVGAPLVLVLACTGGALERGRDGGGVGSIAATSDGGATPLPGGAAGPGVADGGVPASADGGGTRTCPMGGDGSGLPSAATPVPNVVATRTPFSCAPLPEVFIFPPAALNPPHSYARCASFSVGAATGVALSPDGRFAVLATGDGIARVVELASRQVVAVLAAPRGMIDRAAFAPDGRSILTLASAQREATLWRTGDWTAATRVWTTQLTGHRYDIRFGGGVAFAPDGNSAVVSPGTGVYLLDVATGKLRQSVMDYAAVMDVAYGLGGSRVVVALASPVLSCADTPNGGVIWVLDASNLHDIHAIADVPADPRALGIPAFRISPTTDLVLVAPASSDLPAVQAFTLSDGAALPAPGFQTLPLAFMPDGASVLMSSGGALQRVGFPDGRMMSVMMVGDAGPPSISADGRVLAFAGKGGDLLRVWNPTAGNALTTVCTAENSAATPQASSLSADGQLVAVGVGSDLRVFRRADGVRIMNVPMDTSLTNARIELSQRGNYVAIAPTWNATSRVFMVPSAARVTSFDPVSSGWLDFLFAPDESKMYTVGERSGAHDLITFGFGRPGVATRRPMAAFSTLLGSSAGCPVLYAEHIGVWRSCGECDDSPIPAGTPGQSAWGNDVAALSADGMFVVAAGPHDAPGVALWRLRPDPAPLLTIPPRIDDSAWGSQEYPVAVTPGAVRILTGARRLESCDNAPRLEVQVHETTSGVSVVDTLPPGLTAVDATVRTLAYGAQLWCAQ